MERGDWLSTDLLLQDSCYLLQIQEAMQVLKLESSVTALYTKANSSHLTLSR